MSACHCDRGWICEEHRRQPWPHEQCPGPGIECLNPRCQYGKQAIMRKALDEAHDREHYSQDVPTDLQSR
jgi:hypothetical protein